MTTTTTEAAVTDDLKNVNDYHSCKILCMRHAPLQPVLQLMKGCWLIEDETIMVRWCQNLKDGTIGIQLL